MKFLKLGCFLLLIIVLMLNTAYLYIFDGVFDFMIGFWYVILIMIGVFVLLQFSVKKMYFKKLLLKSSMFLSLILLVVSFFRLNISYIENYYVFLSWSNIFLLISLIFVIMDFGYDVFMKKIIKKLN